MSSATPYFSGTTLTIQGGSILHSLSVGFFTRTSYSVVFARSCAAPLPTVHLTCLTICHVCMARPAVLATTTAIIQAENLVKSWVFVTASWRGERTCVGGMFVVRVVCNVVPSIVCREVCLPAAVTTIPGPEVYGIVVAVVIEVHV